MVILAADDDEEDFEFFVEAIREIDESIVVLKASNGQQALDVLENHILEPDYIFLDINMPLMDGRECLRAIKQHPRHRKIPLVMYSTGSNQQDIAEFEAMGARFLPKPYQFSKLVSALAEVLGYPRSHR